MTCVMWESCPYVALVEFFFYSHLSLSSPPPNWIRQPKPWLTACCVWQLSYALWWSWSCIKAFFFCSKWKGKSSFFFLLLQSRPTAYRSPHTHIREAEVGACKNSSPGLKTSLVLLIFKNPLKIPGLQSTDCWIKDSMDTDSNYQLIKRAKLS